MPSSSSVLGKAPVFFKPAQCSRCLSSSHPRQQCNNAIKCLACYGWGHVAVLCQKNSNPNGSAPMEVDPVGASDPKGKGQLPSQASSSWFCSILGQQSGPRRPPIFSTCADLAAHLNANSPQAALAPQQPVVIHWRDPSTSKSPVSYALTLGGGFSSLVNINSTLELAPVHSDRLENPHREVCQQRQLQPVHIPHPIASPTPCEASDLQATQADGCAMAYQRADPAPFVPNGMHRLNVPGRVPMVCAVARSRPQHRHEIVAIINIEPLPGIALHFPNVRAVLEEFFDERRIGFSDI